MHKKEQIPRIVIRSISFGLFIMAFFTMMWNGIAESGFDGKDHYLVTIIFSVVSLIFVAFGLFFLKKSKYFPRVSTDIEQKTKSKMMKWYGIIFGLEGLIIGLTSGLLFLFTNGDLIIPVIALIVGIHFYPMAKLFKRKIDYYIATWTCIIALLGIYLTLANEISQADLFSFIGIGVGFSTISYGIYMIYTGVHLLPEYSK